ncbi:stage II sporulation protein R [Sporolactobacillus sp. Y61]|jgi:stage II sporulation protein R|uniref:Stage II sporulation protein R n=1 Tax=Sporolactobacillus sp. Y61 TaxID=3160863 RepID=A0AAU8IIQ7_9BACL
MKRSLALIFLFTIILTGVLFFTQSHSSRADDQGPIPKDAIRLRILANSDSPADQVVKRQVRDAVNRDISGWVQNLESPEQAEKIIHAHLPELRQTVMRTLRRVHADPTFTIKLGQADFPTKMYGEYVYPAGEYKALVITLGDGKGANWWCVLFPPLCFLDFSNSEAVPAQASSAMPETQAAEPEREKSEKKIEVRSFAGDLFNKIRQLFD